MVYLICVQESMCIAFATAEMCSLQKVQEALQQDHSFIVTHLPEGMIWLNVSVIAIGNLALDCFVLDVWNAVHATVKSDETQPSGDIFIFRSCTIIGASAALVRVPYTLARMPCLVLRSQTLTSPSTFRQHGAG